MSSQPFLTVTVSDPVKQGDKLSAYITYKVNVATNRPEFQFDRFSSVRRYSDFLWLRERLAELVPGSIVPPLPEKSVVNRFSPEFVESRRRALEKFLTRVSQHGELSACPLLKNFLQFDEASLKSLVLETKASAQAQQQEVQKRKSSAGGGGLMKWFDDTVVSIQSTVQVPNIQHPDDIKFDETLVYINSLEAQMSNVLKHTETMLKKEKEVSNSLFEFGLAFTLFGQSEPGSTSSVLTAVGHASDELSVLSNQQITRENDQFVEPIEDYVRVLGAVKAAIAQRNNIKAKFNTTVATADYRKNSESKLKEQNAKEDRLSAAIATTQIANQEVEEMRILFESVNQRLSQEIDSFKQRRDVEMKQTISDFVQSQVEYHKKVEQTWQNLYSSFDQTQFPPPNNGLFNNSNQRTTSQPQTQKVKQEEVKVVNEVAESKSDFRDSEEGDLVGV